MGVGGWSGLAKWTAPKCSATSSPADRARGRLIFWDSFSHIMMNPFSSAEEGEMSSAFSSAIICGCWNRSVAIEGVFVLAGQSGPTPEQACLT